MPQRIQLSRRKGSRKPEDAISVARPSMWGNPFPIARWGREMAVALFRETASGMWRPRLLQGYSDEFYAEAYDARVVWLRRLKGHPAEVIPLFLRGHDLACWCALDETCHADVLLEIANAR